MATPVFQAAGTGVNGSSSAVTYAWPAHAVGDVALLVVESEIGVTLSTPSGFTAVTGSPVEVPGATTATTINAWWCRATSTSMPSVVTAGTTNHQSGKIVTFRGCLASGSPIGPTNTFSKPTASAFARASGVTTTTDENLIVAMISRSNDSATSAFSFWLNDNFVVSELDEYGASTGHGGGRAVAAGAMLVAGPTGDITASVTSSGNASLTVALLPAAAGGGGVSGSLDETLGALVAAGSGASTITGGATQVLGPATVASAGKTPIVGAVSKVLGGASITAGAKAPASAALNKALGASACASTAASLNRAAVAVPLQPVAISAAAKGGGNATASVSLAPIGATAAAAVEVAGAAFPALAAATLSTVASADLSADVVVELDAVGVVAEAISLCDGSVVLLLESVGLVATANTEDVTNNPPIPVFRPDSWLDGSIERASGGQQSVPRGSMSQVPVARPRGGIVVVSR